MSTFFYSCGIVLLYAVATSSTNTHSCGERYLTANNDFKNLVSPGFPSRYVNDMDCFWTIHAEDTSQVVHVNVLYSSVEGNDNTQTCSFDNVTAYNGPTNDRKIMTWCRRDTPNITSTGQYLTFHMSTDSSVVESGFKLQYKQTPAKCDQDLSATFQSRYFYSPGFPNLYENNLNCTWIIRTTYSKIKLEVMESNLGYSYSCTADRVNVIDGSTEQPLGTFCGTQKPTYYSKGPFLRVNFITDGTGQYQGFRIKYTGGFTFNGNVSCGGNLLATSISQRFISPGYPRQYPSNLNCTWVITTVHPQIQLKVEDSLLDYSRDCTKDYVKVYNGLSNEILGTFCRYDRPVYNSSGQIMRVVFVTDGSFGNKGFRMKYTGGTYIGTAACGDNYRRAYTYSQYLTSPGYPANYQNNIYCKWTMEGWTGYRIRISVIYADLAASDCARVYDGSTPSSHLLGSVCGTRYPTFESSGNSITVTFRSNQYGVARGFKMNYTSEQFNETSLCGRSSLTAYSYTFSYLQSPGYPLNYENHLDCSWVIRATPDSYDIRNIQVVVLFADTEASGCRYDAVSVFDGPGVTARLLGKFCGSDRPTYVSSGSSLTVKFHTDGSIVGKGFRLSYKSGHFNGQLNCGVTTLSANSFEKYLTSPGYPNEYPSNLDCTWKITASIDYKINLTVLNADMEADECINAAVDVFDGSSTTATRLGRFCGREKPSYVSSWNAITVRFKTDGSVVGNGFRMSYKAGHFPDSRQCGSSALKAYSYTNYLTSPGFPHSYANNLNCIWTITSDSYMDSIKIIVIYANMESSGCQYDNVTIYDGPSTASSLVGKFCGAQKPTFVSSGSSVTVAFQTDSNNIKSGFRLSYRSGDFMVCENKEVTVPSAYYAVITSPFYPMEYPNGADCTWTIYADRYDYVVYLVVTDFSLESSSGCYADYLQVYDDRYGYGTSLGKWCGDDIPPAQYSSGQYLFIKFHSNDYERNTGFKLHYSSQMKSRYHSSTHLGFIIGGIAAASIFIFSIVCVVAYRAKKNRRQTPRPAAQRQTNERTRTIYMIGDGQRDSNVAPVTFSGPPSYDEIMGSSPGLGAEAPPPPYSAILDEHDTDTAYGGPKDEETDVEPSIDVSDTEPILLRGEPSDDQGIDNPAGTSGQTPEAGNES